MGGSVVQGNVNALGGIAGEFERNRLIATVMIVWVERLSRMKCRRAVRMAVVLALSFPAAAGQDTQESGPEAPPVSANGVIGSVPGGLPIDNEKVNQIVTNKSMRLPRIPVPTRVRVSSSVMRPLLIKKVTPHYPPAALREQIAGTVVLRVNIDKRGNVSTVDAVSGSPLLIPAAIEAVEQWKYKPYLLRQIPVEVETEVRIDFSLSGTKPRVLIAVLPFGMSCQFPKNLG